jgi:hypothetical protein
VKSHVKREERCCPDDPRSLQLPSNLKAYLFEISLYGENQRGQSGERLEGSQIRIGSIPEGRGGELARNKREQKSGGEVRG